MESTDKPQAASRKVKVDVLKEENDQLQSKLQEQLEEAKQKDLEVQKLKAALVQKDGQLNVYKYQTPDYSRKEEKVFLPKPVFFAMIAILVGLAAFAAYSFFFKKEEKQLSGVITYADTSKEAPVLDPTDSILMDIQPSGTTKAMQTQPEQPENVKSENEISSITERSPAKVISKKVEQKSKTSPVDEQVTITRSRQKSFHTKQPAKEPKLEKPNINLSNPDQEKKATVDEPKKKSTTDDDDPNYVELPPQGKYYVNVARAYLYDQPDMKTKGYFYMVPSNNSILFSLDEKNGFIFVEFKSSQGLDLRGWIKTSDLVKIN